MTPVVPEPTPETEGFWAALADGRLVARRCAGCGSLHPTPRRFCPACGAEEGAWEALPEAATIYSVTTVGRPPPDRPYLPQPCTIAILEFDGGHRMLGLVVCDAPDRLGIGQPVRFVPWRRDGVVLPAFRPVQDLEQP